MTAQTQAHPEEDKAVLPGYSSLLLAVDSSDHANRGTLEAIGLATHFHARLTAAHVYAAKLHDARFRQMEGGLPEQFREEQELERQRDVHDDLITRGLSIITDSYLDQVETVAADRLPVERCSLEGKNYRELVNEANSGRYDLLVMGALGLGAVKGSRLGTVCQRVSRRSSIDTLIIKDPNCSLSDSPIVVGVDGSAKSYGGLLTALSLAKAWGSDVKVVSAFDPYYHYVAFNRIAGVLSEEAGKVFRFQEQEKLHEEIIDSGLAKIYQGHLSVAQSIAADHGTEVETVLLDGKPHEVINRYLNEVKPGLLVLGTTGIHADPELDIGGNTEYLLNDAPCAVLLSQREYQPQVDRLASVSTSWTQEAEARMERVPSFVRSMARMAILRYAQEKGHTVITESIVEEATAQLMPGHAGEAMEEIVSAYDRGELRRKPDAPQVMRWSDEATALLLSIRDLSLRGNLSMRAEKKARTENSPTVEAVHLQTFLHDDMPGGGFQPGTMAATQAPATEQADGSQELQWQAAALARLMRVPEGFMRDSSRQRIEDYARKLGLAEVSLETAEAGLAEARKAMEAQMGAGSTAEKADGASACPFGGMMQSGSPARSVQEDSQELPWDTEAEVLLNNVPPGFCRDMTRKAAQGIAARNGRKKIDASFIQEVLQTFQSGSEQNSETMPWAAEARQRIARAPDKVRGMLIQEIEGWSRRRNLPEVNEAAVDAVKALWAERGIFHLDPDDPRNG
ncbi:MAG TPA: universal stress protein UspA [Thiolapillus brandeum]|uniref:Universal stress protein UspA n=1 Tax=Thiolapillus brandeum TaxID=1076588 RepID=A0A831RQW6_9GAMM|nr:universal stress protein UspA [Thiolapillus brandeum]